MAIPNKYIDKIKDKDSGESRPICPPAEHVQVDNENFEGETLDEVLDEVAQAIEDAGQGGYAPPAGGIPKTDLAQSVQDSLDKADSALQDEDVAEVAKTGDYDDLQNKPTIPDTSNLATKTELATKQDALVAGNGITIGNDGKTVSVDAEVVTPQSADGTFTIRIGNNEYTINLNHEHENMAKLVVDTAANLPDMSEMEEDTIYGVNEDGEISVLYVGGIPFYGGGGASTGPVLRRPADGSTINVGQTVNGSASYPLNIKGKNLTQPLIVEFGNGSTGYSFDTRDLPTGVTYDSNTGKLTITKEVACSINGVYIPVVYTGNDTDENAEGTIGISSSSVDGINAEVTLIVNKVAYEDLAGVKLTGTQWLQTDYKPNANTEFVIDMRFELNSKSNTQGSSADIGSKFLDCTDTNNKKFTAYNGQANNSNQFGSRIINFINESSITYGSGYQQLKYNNDGDTAGQSAFLAEHFILSYIKQSSNGVLQAVCGGLTRSCNTSLKTTTMSSPMVICYDSINNKIYEKFNLTIYSFVITENGSEVRHWVPRKRNGVPGLYDTVTHSFISSETSTELVAVN